MKKTNIVSWIIITLFTYSLFATNVVKSTGTKPVDEGQKIVHQDDTTKGSNDFNNTRIYKEVSLSSIKKVLTIKRQDINHAPFICLHYDGKTKEITTLATEESGNTIDFNINKEKLKKEDRIFVINNVKSKKKNRPMGKDVIIEIEITK